MTTWLFITALTLTAAAGGAVIAAVIFRACAQVWCRFWTEYLK